VELYATEIILHTFGSGGLWRYCSAGLGLCRIFRWWLDRPFRAAFRTILEEEAAYPSFTEVAYLLCKTYSVGVLRLAVFVKQYRLEASQLEGLLSLTLLEASTASEQGLLRWSEMLIW
jgi:hypothetical protein